MTWKVQNDYNGGAGLKMAQLKSRFYLQVVVSQSTPQGCGRSLAVKSKHLFFQLIYQVYVVLASWLGDKPESLLLININK